MNPPARRAAPAEHKRNASVDGKNATSRQVGLACPNGYNSCPITTVASNSADVAIRGLRPPRTMAPAV